jgi:hypothetical protein
VIDRSRRWRAFEAEGFKAAAVVGVGCAVVWAAGVALRDAVVGEDVEAERREGGGARVAVASVASAREAVAEVLSAVRREAVGAAAQRRTRRRRPVRRRTRRRIMGRRRRRRRR